jgi:hypothetical protein
VTTLPSNQPLAYQPAQMLVRCGGVKGNISSGQAIPFNFSAPSHNNFLSRAAYVLIIVGGLHHIYFSIPAPRCIFSPIVLSTFSTFQRGLSTPNFQSSPTQTKWARRYPPFWSRVVKYFLAPRRPVLSNRFPKRNASSQPTNFYFIKPSTPRNRLPMG